MARQALIIVISQINLLLSLVNDSLDFKLIEESRFVAKKETFKIRDLLDFIKAMFVPQMQLVGNTFTARVEENENGENANQRMPNSLHGDQIRLKQVLINLVKNALKFTQGGAIEIATSYDAHKELLKCRVIDNGLGFNESEK